MTTTQVAYWTLQEEKRKNRAQEQELNRSNLAREAENYRSNLAKEGENYRSNREREMENYRSNFAREQWNERNLLETQRANLAKEAISSEKNKNDLSNYVWQSVDRNRQITETHRSNRANEGQREIEADRNYELGKRQADTAEKTGKSQRFQNYVKGSSNIWSTVKDMVKTIWNLGKHGDAKNIE